MPLLFKWHKLMSTDWNWEQRDNDSVTNFPVTFLSPPCLRRRFFQTAHFYVEESSSPRVVANENIPVIPIPGTATVHFQVLHVKELGATAAIVRGNPVRSRSCYHKTQSAQ